MQKEINNMAIKKIGAKKRDIKKKKHTDKIKTEEVCEVFEVGKDGEEKIVRVCDLKEDAKPATKEEVNRENKLLGNILIAIGLFVLIFIVFYMIINSNKHFEYNGVKFDKIKDEKLSLYRTSIPVSYQGGMADYNFYLRNDPRKLADIGFNGELILAKNAVFNMTEDFNCNGDGIIGVANLVKLYELFGINVIKDDNATCDYEGRYMFIRIQSGNETSIEKTGPACYNLNVNNCEVLGVTERMMLETFIKFNKIQEEK